MTIQIKATEQYFPVVLFIILYKVVLTYEFVDGIRKFDHSNESYWAILSYGAVSFSTDFGIFFGLFSNFNFFKILNFASVRS